MRKKYFTLIIISIVFLLLSNCKKEQDPSSSLLIGKWNQVSITMYNYYDNVKLNETTTAYSAGELVLEIYDDGTAKKFLNGTISDGFYWQTEGNLLITTNSNGVIQNSEFAVNKTDLTIKWAVEFNTDGHISKTEYMSTYKRAT